MCAKAKVIQMGAVQRQRIFRFGVWLLSGPLTSAYLRENPEAPLRVIDIRGDQTLADLHEAIFEAFDRHDPHLYEFQIGGKKIMDRKAVRYGPGEDERNGTRDAGRSAIASLGLKEETKFFYWFDFGDDWWHELELLAISPPESGAYPRLVERRGESPPQYPDDSDDDGADAEEFATLAELYENVELPPALRELLEGINSLTGAFCREKLTQSYAGVCETLLVACFMNGLPIGRGRAESWAAGIAHAAGMINFLGDPASAPHMKLRDIAQGFGVSQAAMENKSRDIRKSLDACQMDPRFCLPEMLLDNPLAWFREINGLVVDMRMLPLETQEAAVKAGIIPFAPGPRPEAQSRDKALPEQDKNETKARQSKKPDDHDK